ncbi:type 4 pilus major pilin [Burkholderia gladioli]|uniref:type 4 pilus major pilin n=1 Tax=Burkholderia gladioli TaxID=28095 RepID=UPI00163E13A7|nr:type 4 pilus major pilin [Burkholderia gladioli]MBU9426395.1 hypothetical protein [Burkholderia gladioli]MDN8063473.1 type 4 pilus major pilin [Burkholderia gladioli]
MQAIIATIIALAIGAMGVIEVMRHSDSLFSSSQVTGQIADISELMSDSKSKMGPNKSRYTNFTTANAQNLNYGGIVPSTMIVNGVLQNRWGNPIQLTNARQGGQAIFTTNWADVQTCADIATGIGGYETITIGSVVFSKDNPPDQVTAINACASTWQMSIAWS